MSATNYFRVKTSMADTDESCDCVSDISGASVVISDENLGLHLRKKATAFKEPNNETILEGNDGEFGLRVPETIGRARFSLEEEPSATESETPTEATTLRDDAKPGQTNHAAAQVHVGPMNKDTSKNAAKSPTTSVFSYLYEELTRGYLLEHDEARLTEKRERVYTFMKIPRELEKFMTYGFFQCTDAFLYLFTFLPLRFIMAFIKLCVKGCLSSCVGGRGRILEPAQICDLIKGFVLVVCCVMMHYVDVSMMYHLIRGQAIIKLYLFYNMLEVADRLFSSFGQDILDSLFWTATEPKGRRREHVGIIPHLILAIVYVFLHAVLVLFQATTLNVAFNSHNKALLTIMMSNNFVELKGSVFKKFEKNNLFQMSCSDVRERFHLIVLLAIVCVRNLTEFSWNMDHLFVLVPDVVLVMLSEFMVDWVKHAFITKFNEISFEVYREYTVSIAYDMSLSRQKNAFADHVDVVSRRMGFIPLPLAAVLVRVITQSLRITQYFDILLVVLFYFCLISLKVLNSILLLGKGSKLISENKEAKQAAKKQSTSSAPTSPTKETTKVVRSKSVGENIHLSPMLGQNSQPPELQTQPSLTPKPLFSNSTVSLSSMGLNEDFVKDNSGGGTPIVLGTDKPKRPPPKPLHEVDRYTMCSNRII